MTLANLYLQLIEPWLGTAILLLMVMTLITIRLAYKRLSQVSKPRLVLVCVLNLVAMLAVIGLVGRAALLTDNPQSATLITWGGQGTETDMASGEEFVLGNRAHQENLQGPNTIVTPEQLLLKYPNLKNLTVKGYGLRKEQLTSFSEVDIDYVSAPVTPGLTEVSWSQSLILGQALTFKGRYENHTDPAPVTAVLKDMANVVVQRMQVLPGEVIELVTQPKVTGNYDYQLQLLNKADEVIEQQRIPVFVSGTVSPKLMLLQSAPSFESKQFANWASQTGTSLIIHTKISRDKFISKRINVEKDLSIDLTPELLAKQDLLIMDGRTLSNLASEHRQWLSEAIDNGLGVLVMADLDLIKTFDQTPPDLLERFVLAADKDNIREVIPQWLGQRAFENVSELGLSVLPAKLSGNGTATLVSTTKQPLSLYHHKGTGKVGLSILRERFRWLTHGELASYSSYWQHILSSLSRSRVDHRFVQQGHLGPRITKNKQKVCAITDANVATLEMTSAGSATPVSLPLNQHRWQPEQACAFFWPGEEGWYKFSLRHQSNGDLLDSSFTYVFSEDSWQSWQQHITQVETSEFIKQQKQRVLQPTLVKLPQPINPLWFWWLLVLSATCLWLERKRH